MPQYALVMSHPPDNCPLTNKAVREFFKKAYPEFNSLARKMEVKVLLHIHLDPNHKSFALLDAPNAETVRDLAVRSGLMHFLEIDFHLVTPIDELFQHVDEMPTVY